MRHHMRFLGFSGLLAVLSPLVMAGWSPVRASTSYRVEAVGYWADLSAQQPTSLVVPAGSCTAWFVRRVEGADPAITLIGTTTSSTGRTLALRLKSFVVINGDWQSSVVYDELRAGIDGTTLSKPIGYSQGRDWGLPFNPQVDGYWLVSVNGDIGLGDGLPPVISIGGERAPATIEMDCSLSEVRVPVSVLDPGGIRSVSVNGLALSGFSVGEKHVTTSARVLLPRQDDPVAVTVRAIDNEDRAHEQELTVYIVRTKGSPYRGQCDACDGIGACTAKDSNETSGAVMRTGDRCLYHRREYRADEPHVDGMGLGWTHWHTAQLCQTTDGVDDFVDVRLPCNRRAEFRRRADGTWEPVEPVEFDLFQEEGSAVPWTVVSREGQRMSFDEQGFMVASVDANGVGDHISLAHDGRLLEAHDDFGNVFTFVNDGLRLMAVVDQTGRRLEYQYATGALGNPLLVQMTKPGGGRRTYSYDDRERLVAVINEVGRAIEQFDYDEYDQLIATRHGPHEVSRNIDWNSRTMTEVDSVRGTTITTFNEFNLVTYRREPTGAEFRYTYDPVTRKQTSMTDANGRTESYGHDDRGNLSSYTDGNGNVWSSLYETINGRECQVRHEDAQGHVTLYIHDALGNLVSTIDPLGNSDLAVYRADGQIASYRDEGGAVTTFSYDELGRRIAETDALGHTSRCSYDTVGNKVSKTDKCGGVTLSEFDGARRLVKTTFIPADGSEASVTEWVYGPRGEIVETIDSRGRVTKHRYDDHGRKVEIERPSGRIERYTLDDAGRLVGNVVVINGHEFEGTRKRFFLDGLDQTVKVQDGAGEVINVLDPMGRLTLKRDREGHETTYTKDSEGRVTAITNPDGSVVRNSYDVQGMVTCVTHPSGLRQEFEYDALWRPVTRRLVGLDGQAQVSGVVYDPVGNVVSTIDPLGRETSYEFDALKRLVAVVDAAGGVTRTAYDPEGRVISVINANGFTWSYRYDGKGRLAETVDPTGVHTLLSYDAGGNLVQKSVDGVLTSFAYDSEDRLVRTDFSDGSSTSVAYDELGNVTEMRASDGAMVTQTFDDLSRLIAIDYPTVNRRLEYQYSPEGRMTGSALVNPTSGERRPQSFEWDTMGRLVKQVAWNGAEVSSTYAADGSLVSTQLPNGVSLDFSYDALLRNTARTYRTALGPVADFRCEYDLADNRIALEDASGRSSFGHDSLNRLVEADYPDGAWERFSYDPAGNRILRQSSWRGVEDFVVDPANRLLQAGNESFAWDGAGRMVRRTSPSGDVRYLWSGEDRLTGVVLADGRTLSYRYWPGSDKMLSRTDGEGGELRYVWDGVNVFETLDSSNARIGSFFQGPQYDQHWSTELDGTPFTFLQDFVNSVRGVTSGGAVEREARFSAFGEPLAGTQDLPYGFGGRPLDSETGLADFRGRQYCGGLGRFLSRDPLGSDADGRIFSFGGQDPVSRTDPSGLFDWSSLKPAGCHRMIGYGRLKGWVIKGHDSDTPYGGTTAFGKGEKVIGELSYREFGDSVRDTLGHNLTVESITQVYPIQYYDDHGKLVTENFYKVPRWFDCMGYAFGDGLQASHEPFDGRYLSLGGVEILRFIEENPSEYEELTGEGDKAARNPDCPEKGIRFIAPRTVVGGGDPAHAFVSLGTKSYAHKWFFNGPLDYGASKKRMEQVWGVNFALGVRAFRGLGATQKALPGDNPDSWE